MIKKIYIIWTEWLNVQRGGVHRVIYSLMRHLPKYGYEVHYLYTEDVYQTFHLYNADERNEKIISLSEMRQFLVDNRCDLLIGQDGVFFSRLSELVAKWHISDMKYVTVYNSSILLMERTFSRHYWKWLAQQSETSLRTKALAKVRLIMYPLWLMRCRRSVLDNFLANYRVTDALVLLSKHEIPGIQKLTDMDLSCCKVINNPLSWEKIESEQILDGKKKQVLIAPVQSRKTLGPCAEDLENFGTSRIDRLATDHRWSRSSRGLLENSSL